MRSDGNTAYVDRVGRRRTPATCHPEHPSEGRGLCYRCYQRARRRGKLADYPRVNRPAQDTLDDYELLRSEGYTKAQIADRLGMSLDALSHALWRARDRNEAPTRSTAEDAGGPGRTSHGPGHRTPPTTTTAASGRALLGTHRTTADRQKSREASVCPPMG